MEQTHITYVDTSVGNEGNEGEEGMVEYSTIEVEEYEQDDGEQENEDVEEEEEGVPIEVLPPHLQKVSNFIGKLVDTILFVHIFDKMSKKVKFLQELNQINYKNFLLDVFFTNF